MVSLTIVCVITWIEVFAFAAVRPKSGSILEVLQVPSVIVIGLVVIVSAANWGFLDPTLEPHLRQVN